MVIRPRGPGNGPVIRPSGRWFRFEPLPEPLGCWAGGLTSTCNARLVASTHTYSDLGLARTSPSGLAQTKASPTAHSCAVIVSTTHRKAMTVERTPPHLSCIVTIGLLDSWSDCSLAAAWWRSNSKKESPWSNKRGTIITSKERKKENDREGQRSTYFMFFSLLHFTSFVTLPKFSDQHDY